MNPDIVDLVNRYFTPFALFLVVTVAFIGSCDRTIIVVAGLLVFISVELNFFTAHMISKNPEKAKVIGHIRVVSNFLVNVIIVYLLINIWKPIWLLFALTPIASAVYYDRKKCLGVALVSAGTLLVIYFIRGLTGLYGWGEAVTYAVFIVLISMFINALCKICYIKPR